MKLFFRWIVALALGVGLMIFFFSAGTLLSGGGHSLTPMTIFFPYGMGLGLLLKDTTYEFVGYILLVGQFPLYTVAVFFSTRWLRRTILILAILMIHALAAVLGIAIYDRTNPDHLRFAYVACFPQMRIPRIM